MFDRISSFFSSRRKKSSGRHHSDASSSPASPLSPRPEQEDGQKTPTPSLRDGESRWTATGGDGVSQTSSPSASSMASLITDGGDLPFADSNSSGRSSVREVYVCRVSRAGSERNSGKATPTASSADPNNHSNSDLGFSESVVEEVSKRLQVNLQQRIVSSSEDDVFSPTTLTSLDIPVSMTTEGPRSPNLTSISLASNRSAVTVGGKGHSTALRGITLGSLKSQTITAQRQTSKDVKSGGPAWSPSPEDTPGPRGDSPILLHKAIWVETHLAEGEEEGWVREGETGQDILKQEREGLRADSPPVLAIPVTVIPEDDLVTQGAADGPPTPSGSHFSSGSSPGSAVSLATASEEFQTSITRPEELKENRSPRNAHVTRKTVSLPSQDRVFAHKVIIISPETSLDGEECSGEPASKPAAAKP